MKLNNNLMHRAKNSKKDEFYTAYDTVAKELKFYTKQLQDKVVYCNCDNYKRSNFVRYFVYNFNKIGLKKLIASNFSANDIDTVSYHFEIDKVDSNISFEENLTLGKLKNLSGNGSFDSKECIEILKSCDIVITNPPFSLFRDFLNTITAYKKKFLLIANQNALTYKNIQEPLCLGDYDVGINFNKVDKFEVPSHYQTRQGENFVKNCYIWLTNLKIEKEYPKHTLTKSYKEVPENFKFYDNYNAINLDKAKDIPYDFDGIIGVPVTFINKLDPKKFELVGFANHGKDSEFDLFTPIVDGKLKYKRLLIKLI